MMDTSIDQLRAKLDAAGVPYEVIPHPQAATSQEAAAATRISGYAFAKSVIAMVDERPHLFVLRATDRLDPKSLRRQLHPRQLRIADEYETNPLFPGAEHGSVPAIPLTEHVAVYLDTRIAAEPVIVFETGTGTDAMRIQTPDYLRLVRPAILDFAQAPRRQRARFGRSRMWRRRALQAAPFVAALSALVLGPRVMGHRAPIRSFALGMAAGAASSSLAEPQLGAWRRGVMRDRSARWLRTSARRLQAQSRFAQGKLRGLWHPG